MCPFKKKSRLYLNTHYITTREDVHQQKNCRMCCEPAKRYMTTGCIIITPVKLGGFLLSDSFQNQSYLLALSLG